MDDQQRARELRKQAAKILADAYNAAHFFGAADDALSETPSPHCQVTITAITADLRAAPEWQPIETAPKDARWIMLGIAGRNEIMLGYWSPLHQAWWGQTCAHGEFHIWQRATHWNPLPAAPAARPQGVKDGN